MSERLSEEQLKYAEKIFASFTKEGHRELTLEDFKKLIPCKNVSIIKLFLKNEKNIDYTCKILAVLFRRESVPPFRQRWIQHHLKCRIQRDFGAI